MASAQRSKPPVVQPGISSILVNPVQRGNGVLNHIKHVAYQFSEIVPDYQVGATTCVLFLSLKYHRLHPEYIHGRIEKLHGLFSLRILLVVCDITEHQDPIRELTKICLINNLTIMIAWNLEEAGIYLSTYKLFEHKPPDIIKERVDKDYISILQATLTSVRGINKTDVTTLRTTFGSFSDIVHASEKELLQCPGLAQTKVKRLKDAFDKPFRPGVATLKARSAQSLLENPLQPSASQSPPSPPPPPRPRPPVIIPSAGPSSARLPHSSVQKPQRNSLSPGADWPEWDIELDLNPWDDSDIPPRDLGPAHKKQEIDKNLNSS